MVQILKNMLTNHDEIWYTPWDHWLMLRLELELELELELGLGLGLVHITFMCFNDFSSNICRIFPYYGNEAVY